MTPEQRLARDAFLAAVRQALRYRALLIKDTEAAVIARLRGAAATMAALLAEQPAEWQQWQLSALQGQVEALLRGLAGDLTTTLNTSLSAGWQAGQAAVDAPIEAARQHTPLEIPSIYMQTPVLSVSILDALRSFTAGRIKDITREAEGAIDRAIGLTVLGSQTPHQTIKAVQATLGGTDSATRRRAQTIVRTQVAEAYALAQQARMEQAAQLLPDLRKQWVRSGKIHSRANHDAADGQTVPVAERFKVPARSRAGFVLMMHPHDPKAPAGEIINCGCIARQWMSRWGLPPGGKPFTELEMRLNPRKRSAAGWKQGE